MAMTVHTNERANIVQHCTSSCLGPPLMAQLGHKLGVSLILLTKQVEFLLLIAEKGKQY